MLGPYYMYWLTNSSDADSSILSCASCVNRNTGVQSISLNSYVEHTRATVSNIAIIKVEMICDTVKRVGICTAD